MAATAGSGTARTMLSSLLATVCMMAESMPASSPARATSPPLARLTPGWAPNTISVRPMRIWSPNRSGRRVSTRCPLM